MSRRGPGQHPAGRRPARASCSSYEAILGELGENLIKASSAREALEHLLETDIAVVLMDVSMPELDGFELAAMIRAASALPEDGDHLRLRRAPDRPGPAQGLRVRRGRLRLRAGRAGDPARQGQRVRRALPQDARARAAEPRAGATASPSAPPSSRRRRRGQPVGRAAAGGGPAEGRVPGDARPRAAQSARADPATRSSILQARGGARSRAARGAATSSSGRSSHLTRLVDDLLDVSRITRGKIELRQRAASTCRDPGRWRGRAEPARCIDDRSARAARSSLPSRAVPLRPTRRGSTQVVANLLNNAAKYTGRGGPDLAHRGARGGRRWSSGARPRASASRPSALPQVFELFSQGDRRPGALRAGSASASRSSPSWSAMHGGTVEAPSDGDGQGSEFIVRLPASRPPARRPRRRRPRASTIGARRILVVDDNVDAAEASRCCCSPGTR